LKPWYTAVFLEPDFPSEQPEVPAAPEPEPEPLLPVAQAQLGHEMAQPGHGIALPVVQADVVQDDLVPQQHEVFEV
jgi:hypothetical protein